MTSAGGKGANPGDGGAEGRGNVHYIGKIGEDTLATSRAGISRQWDFNAAHLTGDR